MNDLREHDPKSNRIEDTHRESSPSTGAYEIAEIFHVPNAHAVDAGTFAAMIRQDRPERYRRKHRRGVSS